ncbi:MAG: hypothetical protein EOP83_18940, partial [Verrucomicrobiaceae bacterium]
MRWDWNSLEEAVPPPVLVQSEAWNPPAKFPSLVTSFAITILRIFAVQPHLLSEFAFDLKVVGGNLIRLFSISAFLDGKERVVQLTSKPCRRFLPSFPTHFKGIENLT